MNLGQYIGELLMQLQGEAPATRDAVDAPKPRGKRQHQVIALLADGRIVSAAGVAVEFGITPTNAGVMLAVMAEKGLISRHGVTRHYRYTKLGVPGPVIQGKGDGA